MFNSLELGARIHALIIGERELLEKTLRGSIEALVEVLSLANPASFGRATQVKHCVTMLLEQLNAPVRWPIEVASMLCTIATVTLSPNTLYKYFSGGVLTAAEQERIAHLPDVTERLLAHIPRLDQVRAICAPIRNPTEPWR